MSGTMRVWSVGAAVLLAVGGMTGCATVQPAAPGRANLTPSATSAPTQPQIAWPPRDPACFDHPVWRAALEQSKDVLVVTTAEERGGKLEVARRAFPITRMSAVRAGVGMLSEFELRITEPKPEPARRFAFFSSRTPVVNEYTLRAGALGPTGNKDEVLQIPLEWPFDPPAGAGRHEPAAQRWPNVPVIEPKRVRLYPADATLVRVWPTAPNVPLRGYAVALRPIAGRAYTLSTLRRLRDDGWQIVEAGLSLSRRFVTELKDSPSDKDVADVAALIAPEVDNELAELAYAIEAALERLDAERDQPAKPPVLMVGFSAGALAAPAVAARLEPRVAGAVFVGGGADLCRILQTSTLANYGLALARGGRPIKGDDLERLDRAYLDATILDPVKTAPRLAGVPVLMLHAANDAIVPAATGEKLYELLGRPERWVFDTGHELLFWRLSGYSGDIARWVREKVPAGPR